jgi:hypothetical protein
VAGGVDARSDIAVKNQPRVCADRPNLVNGLRVTGAVENRNLDLADGFVFLSREFADVVAERLGDVHHTDRIRARHQLLHVKHARRIEHRAAIGDREH